MTMTTQHLIQYITFMNTAALATNYIINTITTDTTDIMALSLTLGTLCKKLL